MAQAKKWNKETIQKLLSENDEAVRKAILAIFSRQTDDEKREGSTKHENGVGFSGTDSVYFSRVAYGIRAGAKWNKAMADSARAKGIAKYWRQLAEIANEKEVEKEEKENGNRESGLSNQAARAVNEARVS